MPDPKPKQIVDAVKAILAAPGLLTPDAVVDVADLTNVLLDSTITTPDPATGPTVYALLPVRWPRAAKTNRTVEIEFTFDLCLARRFNHDNESPFPSQAFTPPDPNRFKVQALLAQDVEKKLCGGDLTLGIANGPWNTRILEWDVSPENTNVAGWAVVFGRAIVTWEYVRDNP